MSGVERPLHAHELHLTQCSGFSSRESLIEPQSGAHFHGAALTVFVEQKQKMHRMDQVRSLTQKALPFPHRFANQTNLAMFQRRNRFAQPEACVSQRGRIRALRPRR